MRLFIHSYHLPHWYPPTSNLRPPTDSMSSSRHRSGMAFGMASASASASVLAFVLAPLLLAGAAGAQSGPNTTNSDIPWLDFNLFLTARSPILRFNEAKDWPASGGYNLTDWTALVDGRNFTPGTVLEGRVTHMMGPDPNKGHSSFSFPMVGTSVRIQGSFVADSDPWLLYERVYPHQVGVQLPNGSVIVDDALESVNFTRREATLYRHTESRGRGTLEIANITVRSSVQTQA